MSNLTRQNEQSDDNHPDAANKIKRRLRGSLASLRTTGTWLRVRWRKIAAWTIGAGTVFGGLLLTSHYVAAITDPVQFVTGNLLNTLIFIAIVAQVLIYRKQRDIMEQQWNAMREQANLTRRSITISNSASVGVHSIEYDKQAHVILVKIENIGLVRAYGISMFMEVIVGIHEPDTDFRENPESARGFLRYRLENESYGSTELLRGNLQITRDFQMVGTLRAKEIDLLEKGRANLSVSGWIKYGDGFTKGAQQTRFFFWYKHIGKGFWTADNPERWAAHFDTCGPADNEEWQDEAGAD
jgi:hypothetical protein